MKFTLLKTCRCSRRSFDTAHYFLVPALLMAAGLCFSEPLVPQIRTICFLTTTFIPETYLAKKTIFGKFLECPSRCDDPFSAKFSRCFLFPSANASIFCISHGNGTRQSRKMRHTLEGEIFTMHAALGIWRSGSL